MPRYKRTFDEAELESALEPVVRPDNVEMQRRLRNMWEFASLMQYIYLFGSVVKIDNDLDIEVSSSFGKRLNATTRSWRACS